MTAAATMLAGGWGVVCREHRLRLGAYVLKATAEREAADHNRTSHAEEMQARADEVALAWAMAGARGVVPPGAFPLWASPACEHPPTRQRRDGRGVVCMECGRLRVLA